MSCRRDARGKGEGWVIRRAVAVAKRVGSGPKTGNVLVREGAASEEPNIRGDNQYKLNMLSMDGGSVLLWGLVRANYARSRHPSCLSLVDSLIARSGAELGLRNGGREENGKVVVWKTASAATAFRRLRPTSLRGPPDGEL